MLQLCVCRDIEHREVWRALKRLESLAPLSYSPNFPRAQYFDIRPLMHELIELTYSYPLRGSEQRLGIYLAL